jgi:uncharacterized protein YjbI with pentapeptide repeats
LSSIDEANLRGSSLQKVDFANFAGADLTGAQGQPGNEPGA